MGYVIKIPPMSQVDELQKFKDEYIGNIDFPVTNVPLESGNLQSILYPEHSYIQYITKNGICEIDFSFCVKANMTTQTEGIENNEEALWVKLPTKLPKPLIMSRGQAVPVNANVLSSANLRIDTDGTLNVLINNYNSTEYTWLQNTMVYILGEQ